MSIPQQPNAMMYSQGFGSSPLNVQTPHLDIRNPSPSDVTGYSVGQKWVNTVGNSSWTLTSFSSSAGITTANWQAEGGGSSALSTLTGNTGTATPSAGNIQIAGAAGITTAASGSVVTVSLTGGGEAIDSFIPDTGTNPVVPALNGSVTMSGTTAQIITTGGLNSLNFAFATPNFTLTNQIALMTGAVTSGITIEANNSSGTLGDVATVAAVATDNDCYFVAHDQQSLAGWAIGNRATASNNLVFSAATDLGTGVATLTRGGALTTSQGITATTGSIAASAGNISASNSSSGSSVNSSVANTSNTAGSDSQFNTSVAGASGGDAYFRATVSGVKDWVFGIDNSDSDAFVFSNSGTIGTTNLIRMDVGTSVVSFPTANISLPAATTGIVYNVTTASGSSAGPVTCNGRVGSITFTAVSIAGNATQAFQMANNAVSGASTLLHITMRGSTTGSSPTIQNYSSGAGTVGITVTNGLGTATQTGNLTFDFEVLN